MEEARHREAHEKGRSPGMTQRLNRLVLPSDAALLLTLFDSCGHRRARSAEENPEQERHENLEDQQRAFLKQVILDRRPGEFHLVACARALFVQAFASLPDRRFLLFEDAVGLGTLSETNFLLGYAEPVANIQGPRLRGKHFAGLGLEHFPAFAKPLQDRRGAIEDFLGDGPSSRSFQRPGPELDVFVVLSRQHFEISPIRA